MIARARQVLEVAGTVVEVGRVKEIVLCVWAFKPPPAIHPELTYDYWTEHSS